VTAPDFVLFFAPIRLITRQKKAQNQVPSQIGNACSFDNQSKKTKMPHRFCRHDLQSIATA